MGRASATVAEPGAERVAGLDGHRAVPQRTGGFDDRRRVGRGVGMAMLRDSCVFAQVLCGCGAAGPERRTIREAAAISAMGCFAAVGIVAPMHPLGTGETSLARWQRVASAGLAPVYRLYARRLRGRCWRAPFRSMSR